MLANIGVNKLTSMNGFQVSAVKREANKVLATSPFQHVY